MKLRKGLRRIVHPLQHKVAPHEIDRPCPERQADEVAAYELGPGNGWIPVRASKACEKRARVLGASRRPSARSAYHPEGEINAQETGARIACVQFSQRLAGSAAGVENRCRRESDDAKALGHSRRDLSVQHGCGIEGRGGSLEGAAHARLVEPQRIEVIVHQLEWG